MMKGEELKAYELLGDQSLDFLREALLIGFTVHQGPPGSEPVFNAPLLKILLRDSEMASVPPQDEIIK